RCGTAPPRARPISRDGRPDPTPSGRAPRRRSPARSPPSWKRASRSLSCDASSALHASRPGGRASPITPRRAVRPRAGIRAIRYNPAHAMKAAELVVACFVLFGACLVWPLLAIANRPVLILGVPALVLYLFVIWAGMVAVLVALARRLRSPEDES